LEVLNKKPKIAIIGLGYVGLPLAIEFGKIYHTIGYDLDRNRINELKVGIDKTLEQTKEQIIASPQLLFSHDLSDITDCNFYIVAVPTPVDKHKNPNLNPLIKASKTVGANISKGDIIIYESTVYPGATEEVCVPVLESKSGLVYNKDFYCGYSPERINPGDKEHTLKRVVKVTSGSTSESAKIVNELYQSIVPAGTHLAPNMATAEAAKVIENIQRDVNIALINELFMIFDKLGINTSDVLEAAGTKWNFQKFRPGLVGGHCIGVDPYYLTYKAQSIGFHPEMILSGRRTNDSMGIYIAQKVIHEMTKSGINPVGAKVGIFGITFKPNCPDIRNTKVIDIINELINCNCEIIVTDPWANKNIVKREYNIELVDQEEMDTIDFGVIAVKHDNFKNIKSKNILTIFS
tara:strand:+ start:158 stop:1375 length:1218 start_codon:yes stop_codon:yes gene_type:complete